jgi:hypothetical protein
MEKHERIVGFQVEPMSLAEMEDEQIRMKFDPSISGEQLIEAGEPFRFTYRIRTIVSQNQRVDHLE